jgi:hypothetical protein
MSTYGRSRATTAARALGLAVVAFLLLLPLRRAWASPAVDGTRNLSLGNVSRGSSYGTNAALINPSNMAFSPMFTVEALYQLGAQTKTHGVGFIVMDSLNNPRVSLGLGYLFMRGQPGVSFVDINTMERRNLELSLFGHEVLGALSITAVKQWLAIGLKPKYQYVSLRYRDDLGIARNANRKLNAFGLDTSLTVNFRGWAAVALSGVNVLGNHRTAYNDERDVSLDGFAVEDGSIDHGDLSDVSAYPIGFEHGLSVFPLRNQIFSINFDGMYDFTSYHFEKHTRLQYGGSAEFIVGPVPLRFGTLWDGRGKGRSDDRVFIAGGVGFVRPAKLGGVGVDVGFGFRQEVSGPPGKETTIGFNLGLRLHPDL